MFINAPKEPLTRDGAYDLLDAGDREQITVYMLKMDSDRRLLLGICEQLAKEFKTLLPWTLTGQHRGRVSGAIAALDSILEHAIDRVEAPGHYDLFHTATTTPDPEGPRG